MSTKASKEKSYNEGVEQKKTSEIQVVSQTDKKKNVNYFGNNY